ncbi:MAG: glucan 1,3-beta-glucosidase [Nocardioidaceae bacterium]|nr:glucan 1,3-beta-glucosidase [Nocardioidaceae bacterium]
MAVRSKVLRMIKGVNLGNWLVLEKWMSPALFTGIDAEDETQLCRLLDPAAKDERFRTHRESYITESDFTFLAERGFDVVRIPVPFFIFGDYDPYVGCIDYLDRAFDWADRHGLGILIDLHTVPDSQNGFDNGGMCGVCKWHLTPDHVEFVLDLLERLTLRYRSQSALWGIEVLNEPVSPELWEGLDIQGRYPPADPVYAQGSEPVPTDFLKSFYSDAYQRIRSASDDVTIVFHDGFRIRELADFFLQSGFDHFFVDIHLYSMEHTWLDGDDDLDGYLAFIERRFAPVIDEMSQRLPLVVGEWCLDTMSAKALDLGPAERTHYFSTLADAQLKTWNKTDGWFFWSYKLQVDGADLDGWDLRKSIELGYLPARLAS